MREYEEKTSCERTSHVIWCLPQESEVNLSKDRSISETIQKCNVLRIKGVSGHGVVNLSETQNKPFSFE